MLWVPQKGRIRVEQTFGTLGDSDYGTAVTTDAASSATKGSDVELIAATAFDAYEITVIASKYGASSTASPGCLDILSGSDPEDVLIPDLLMGGCGGVDVGASGRHMPGKTWTFPLYIPAGTRLAARAAGARLSTAVRVSLILRGGNGMPWHRVGRKVTTYGIGTVPNGTSITQGTGSPPGAGSFTQITAATSEDHFYLMPSWQYNDNVTNPGGLVVAIGVGAATEDEVGQWMYFGDNVEILGGPLPPFGAFVDVPSGTRLAMRASYESGGSETANGAIHAVS